MSDADQNTARVHPWECMSEGDVCVKNGTFIVL